MLKHVLLITSLILATLGVAQEKQVTLSGIVKNKTDGEYLIGATVRIKESAKGVVSNLYGFYSITLPSGEYEFETHFLGFQNVLLKIDLQRDTTVNIELEELTSELEEVIITGETQALETTDIGLGHFSPSAIKKLPSLLGEADIQRAILTLPGITSVGEISNGFNVRGGKVDHNLILVDEAPIFNSSHLFGLINVVNPDAVQDVKVYKAGIPSKYGGRAASVVDIYLHSGNNKHLRIKGGLGVLSSRLSVEVPIIKEKLNVYASARRSFADLLLKGALDGGNVGFYDASTKLTYRLNKNNAFYFSGYFGRDILGFSGDSSTNNFVWGNTTGTFRWNHIFNSKIFSNLTLLQGDYDFLFKSTDGELFGGNQETEFNTGITNTSFKYDFSYFPKLGYEFSAGFGTTYYKFTSGQPTNDIIPDLNTTKTLLESFAYVDVYLAPTDKLNVRAGLRVNTMNYIGPGFTYEFDPNFPPSPQTILSFKRFDANESIAKYLNFEPRVSLNYRITPNISAKVAYDRLTQNIHLLSNSTNSLPFDSWTPSTNNIKPTLVDQFSIGGAFEHKGLVLELGGYFKKIENLLEFRTGGNAFLIEYIETQILPAKGESYGAELSVSKEFEKTYFKVNYTYSRSFAQTTSSVASIQINQGKKFAANHDRPHVLDASFSYKLSKRTTLNTQFIYQTGRPITLPTGIVDQVVIYSKKNQFRVKPTHRLDVSLTIDPKPKKDKKFKGYWTFSIINLYGRKNPFAYALYRDELDFDNVKLQQFSVLGSVIPSFTYNFQIN